VNVKLFLNRQALHRFRGKIDKILDSLDDGELAELLATLDAVTNIVKEHRDRADR